MATILFTQRISLFENLVRANVLPSLCIPMHEQKIGEKEGIQPSESNNGDDANDSVSAGDD